MSGERSLNVRRIGHSDVGGIGNGGQIAVQHRGGKYYAFVAHMKDASFTILDVTDPTQISVMAQVPIAKGTHSHKLRVYDNLVYLNNEQYGSSAVYQAGLRIYDVTNPKSPREASFFKTGGRGVHRFWIDRTKKLLYMAAGAEGFVNEIVQVLDISSPLAPRLVSRWWLNGQWVAGGEQPTWDTTKEKFTAHGPPIPLGNRLFCGYWDAGFVILDISNIQKPSLVSRCDFSPPYGGCTHTALPINRPILGRKWLVVTDEAIVPRCKEEKKVAWFIDVSYDRNPVPVSTFQVWDEGFCEQGGIFGPHNIHEDTAATNDILYFTWGNAGVRLVDISNPYLPREIGYYIPPTPGGQESIQTNDVTVDDRGLIYIIDRINGGLDILVRTL